MTDKLKIKFETSNSLRIRDAPWIRDDKGCHWDKGGPWDKGCPWDLRMATSQAATNEGSGRTNQQWTGYSELLIIRLI